jgi:hypothetical protein
VPAEPQKPAALPCSRVQLWVIAALGSVESWSVPSELDEFSRARIDPSWSGEMPRTLLIGADGSVTTLRGVADPVQIARWLTLQSTGTK